MTKRKVPKSRTVSVKLSPEELRMLDQVKAKMRGRGKDAPMPSNSYVLRQALKTYLAR